MCTIFLLLASEASKVVVLCACHTVISNLAITRIILNPFYNYNAAVYTAYSEPTMHCIHLVYIYIYIYIFVAYFSVRSKAQVRQ